MGVIGGVAAFAAGIAASIAIVVFLTATVLVVAGNRRMQHAIERVDRARLVHLRRDRRAARLSHRALATAPLHELTKLVDAIERSAPDALQTFELEELLDYYVDIVLARERTARAVATDCRAAAHAHSPVTRPASLQAIQARWHQAFLAARQRQVTYEQELAAIESFVRLVALHVALQDGAAVLDDAQLEDRLSRMNEVEVDLLATSSDQERAS